MKTKIVMIVIITLMLTSCKKDTTTANEVALSNLSFTPKTLTVPVGATVTWVNNEAVTHTVTSDAGIFESGNLTKGNSYKYTFTGVGSFPYHCTFHSGMTGTIIVSANTTTGTGTGY